MSIHIFHQPCYLSLQSIQVVLRKSHHLYNILLSTLLSQSMWYKRNNPKADAERKPSWGKKKI